MSAWFLFRCAAGMENELAFGGRQAGEFQFLECAGGHGGDLSPMLHRSRRRVPSFADFLIRSVVGELQREQFEGERIEFVIGRLPRRSRWAKAGAPRIR